jgi:hypothetical protein
MKKKPPAPTAMAHLKRGSEFRGRESSTSMAPCYGTNRTMVGSRPAVFRPVVTEQAVSLCALFSRQGSASPNYSRPAPARNGGHKPFQPSTPTPVVCGLGLQACKGKGRLAAHAHLGTNNEHRHASTLTTTSSHRSKQTRRGGMSQLPRLLVQRHPARVLHLATVADRPISFRSVPNPPSGAFCPPHV